MVTPGSTALPGDEEKAAHAYRMFSSIAPRYDLLKDLLSLNIHRRWRRRAVDTLGWDASPDGTFLYNCAGALDLCRELANRSGLSAAGVGVISRSPCKGRESVASRPPDRARYAEALRLSYRDASFDGAVFGFGVRNLASLEAGLARMARCSGLAPAWRSWSPSRPSGSPYGALFFTSSASCPGTAPARAGSRGRKGRRRFGSESTHCRTASEGSASWLRWAATSTMRRVQHTAYDQSFLEAVLIESPPVISTQLLIKGINVHPPEILIVASVPFNSLKTQYTSLFERRTKNLVH